MDANQVMKDIIRICLFIDEVAKKKFEHYADTTDDEDRARFWRSMSRQESGHCLYWRQLADMAAEGMLPIVFEDPVEVLDELSQIFEKISEIEKNSDDDIRGRFLVAFRLEFYMLHRAFATLFHLLKNFTDKRTPEDDYDDHISMFIKELRRAGDATPEFELVADTIQHLWHDNRKLAVQTTTDALTGALNRHGMNQSVYPMAHLARRNGNPVAVVMIDIDDFKKVNDAHGHPAGDEVLRGVAATIRSAVRRSDIVCRFGGEEFLVFLPALAEGAGARVAEKIRSLVAEADYGGVKVTVSLGVAESVVSENVDDDVNAFIQKADDSLYEAKRAGKNRVAVAK